MTKAEFLNAYGFPEAWLSWDLYPDELFERQFGACGKDREPQPAEHLRYEAFIWWLRTQRSLPVATLKQLAQLAAMDPDPPMSGAAAHDILFHPSATEEVAEELAQLTEDHAGWTKWAEKPNAREFFRRLLDEGRRLWRERHAAHKVARDIDANHLSIEELRELFALRSPLVLRGLVEHPGTPRELLHELCTLEAVRFAKEIRMIAKLRLENKRPPPSNYRAKYSTDPWSWPR